MPIYPLPPCIFQRNAKQFHVGTSIGALVSQILCFPWHKFHRRGFAKPDKFRALSDMHKATFELMGICNVNGPRTHPVFVECM